MRQRHTPYYTLRSPPVLVQLLLLLPSTIGQGDTAADDDALEGSFTLLVPHPPNDGHKVSSRQEALSANLMSSTHNFTSRNPPLHFLSILIASLPRGHSLVYIELRISMRFISTRDPP